MDKTTLVRVLGKHKAWLKNMGGERADLCGADLRKADLRDADLCWADLRETYLRDACLCGADLRKADLCDAYLCGADLCGVDLCGAYLRGAELRGANLHKADLRGAELSDADLKGANLCEARLVHARLQGADLTEADLSGADLYGARLRGANLHRVNMSQKIVQVGPIGSRSDYTVYHVEEDIVQCGCWREYMGGALADFVARINEAYPEDNKDGAKYRREYLAAIAMFQALREDYLKDLRDKKRITKGEEV
nr:MAG TPA: pentapeptide repeat protein [Caudoviricetes sp.]